MRYFILFIFLFFVQKSFAQNTPKVIIPYKTSQGWKICDTLGKVTSAVVYDTIMNIQYDGYISNAKTQNGCLVKQAGKYKTLINLKPILPPATTDSTSLMDYTLDYFKVYKNNKVGVANRTGILINCLYDDIQLDENNSFLITQDNKKGICNSHGRIVVPIEYQRISGRKSGNIFKWRASGILTDEEFHTDIDVKAKELDARYGPLYEVSEARMSESSEKDFSDMKTKYDDYEEIAHDLYLVLKDNRYGIYDLENQKEIIPTIYRQIQLHWPGTSYYYLCQDDHQNLLCNHKGTKILQADTIYRLEQNQGTYYYQNRGLTGAYLTGTTYPAIAAKYTTIQLHSYIPVSPDWVFTLFLAQDAVGNSFYVGENGKEYRQ